MSDRRSYIPEGYHAITPCLIVENAGTFIEFLKETFGAEERMRSTGPDGSVQHAEICIGDAVLMVGERMENGAAETGTLYVYVPNCDATYQRALALGARSLNTPADQHWGDRMCAVVDGWGNRWNIATPVAALVR